MSIPIPAKNLDFADIKGVNNLWTWGHADYLWDQLKIYWVESKCTNSTRIKLKNRWPSCYRMIFKVSPDYRRHQSCISTNNLKHLGNLNKGILSANYALQKVKEMFHLWLKIAVHHTLKMTKCNNIQYLNHDSLCIIFWVFSAPSELIQHTVSSKK